MIDRKKGPAITTDFDLELRGIRQSQLPNGLPVHEFNSGTQNIIKVALVYRTGRIHERRRATAKAALSLIREGSTRHSSEELAEVYDYYGAVVKTSVTMETCSVSLVVVERYFAEVWPIWFHMVFYPMYDSEELEKYKQVTASKFVRQLAKNDVQGYRKLTEALFGADHPYGYNTEVEDIQALDREDLLGYYNECLGLDDAFLVLSGSYSEATRTQICTDLGQKKRHNKLPPVVYDQQPLSSEVLKISTDKDVQVSIKMGRRLFERKHPDFPAMRFLNLILGGYFGSRLMKNIREDKGYTYGIYSSVHSWRKDGFIYISAEVANDYLDPTLKEIHKEMERLRDTIVPEAEMEMVRNYILGQTLHLLDGPFAKGELIMNLQKNHRTIDDFHAGIDHARTITADTLQQMAQKYLDPADYLTVLTGQL